MVNCREVMSLKFVTCASDLESADQFFSPVYVHQLFMNEKIIGYRDLEIRVFFSQPHLHCYIEIDYGEKLEETTTTDILGVFRKWIKAGFTVFSVSPPLSFVVQGLCPRSSIVVIH